MAPAEVRGLVFERLRALLAEQFSVSEDSITMETSFADDLGADSLDVVEMNMALEEEFDIPETDEEELVKLTTVGDVFRYISNKVD
jgi:acyl carrier protein